MIEWRTQNPDKVKKSKKPLTARQAALQKLRQRAWYQKNKTRILDERKKYRQDNAEKIRVYRKTQRTIPHHRFRHRLANRIRAAVKAKGVKKLHRTENLLGCTIQFFMGHLEQKFQAGMAWDNYGEWHIDHIIPCASFNLLIESEQLRCFHYTNLQPLWAQDNLRKSSQIVTKLSH